MVELSILDNIQSQLRDLNIDQIIEMIGPLVVGVAQRSPTISAGTTLFRGRKITESFNKERGIKVADLSHPPSHRTRLVSES